jgi:hypothetical protein
VRFLDKPGVFIVLALAKALESELLREQAADLFNPPMSFDEPLGRRSLQSATQSARHERVRVSRAAPRA